MSFSKTIYFHLNKLKNTGILSCFPHECKKATMDEWLLFFYQLEHVKSNNYSLVGSNLHVHVISNSNTLASVQDIQFLYLQVLQFYQLLLMCQEIKYIVGLFQYGLNMMMGSKDGLTLLARSIDPAHPSMMADVVKVMAAVSLVQ